jgi:hypothetical protein
VERRFYQKPRKRVNTIFQIFLTRMQKDALPPNKPAFFGGRGDPPAWVARMRAKENPAAGLQGHF